MSPFFLRIVSLRWGIPRIFCYETLMFGNWAYNRGFNNRRWFLLLVLCSIMKANGFFNFYEELMKMLIFLHLFFEICRRRFRWFFGVLCSSWGNFKRFSFFLLSIFYDVSFVLICNLSVPILRGTTVQGAIIFEQQMQLKRNLPYV